MWREILHMVNDGVATTGELDESIIYGPGLRWAAMGTNLIYHLAGGETGMRHMLAQFGPCLKWPWTKLEAPELTETLIDRMVEGTQAQAGGPLDPRARAAARRLSASPSSRCCGNSISAPASTLRALEERLYEDAARAPARLRRRRGGPAQRLRRISRPVRPEWVDYNGHMSDFALLPGVRRCDGRAVPLCRHGRCLSRNGPGMFYTVEVHVTHLAEAKVNEPLYVHDAGARASTTSALHVFHAVASRRDDDV